MQQTGRGAVRQRALGNEFFWKMKVKIGDLHGSQVTLSAGLRVYPQKNGKNGSKSIVGEKKVE